MMPGRAKGRRDEALELESIGGPSSCAGFQVATEAVLVGLKSL